MESAAAAPGRLHVKGRRRNFVVLPDVDVWSDRPPNLKTTHTFTHTHTGANTGRRRGDRTQIGTRTSRHRRRTRRPSPIAPRHPTHHISRTSAVNAPAPSLAQPARLPDRQPARSRPPAARLGVHGDGRRMAPWRHAPGIAHEVSELVTYGFLYHVMRITSGATADSADSAGPPSLHVTQTRTLQRSSVGPSQRRVGRVAPVLECCTCTQATARQSERYPAAPWQGSCAAV